MCNFNKFSVLMTVFLASLSIIILVVPFVEAAQGPYINGAWEQTVPLREQTAYMFCMYQGDLTVPDIRGTVFCFTHITTDFQTILGTIKIFDKMAGVWERHAEEEYKSKVVACVSNEKTKLTVGQF